MKRFSFLPASVLLFAITAVLFVSCQKEQSVAPTEPEAAASEGVVKGIAGGGSYAGSIKPSYAASLAANYVRKFGDDDDQTQSVAFSAKDLIAFINGLQAKYKSDIIYVNFGVYGRGAAPVNGKDWGRLTVFFTGNKIPSPVSSRRNDGVVDELLDDVLDEFLNHGGLVP